MTDDNTKESTPRRRRRRPAPDPALSDLDSAGMPKAEVDLNDAELAHDLFRVAFALVAREKGVPDARKQFGRWLMDT